MLHLNLLSIATVLTTANAAVTPASGRGTLVQAQVIARHGARTPLTKTAASLFEGGAVLTPIGQLQQYELGVWLGKKYRRDLNLETYNSQKIHLQSSDFDRTVVSASSLALGMFPETSRAGHNVNGLSLLPSGVTPANVPVHTKARINDLDIRAYTLCPTLQTRRAELYKQEEFLDLEMDNLELLTYLGGNINFVDFLHQSRLLEKEKIQMV